MITPHSAAAAVKPPLGDRSVSPYLELRRRASKLRYGDLIQLLERMHALPRGRRVATDSRIKNFSRLGFPDGPRVGSGERAEYGVGQVIQLLVAFELLRLRMPPAAIAEVIRTEWTRIVSAFAAAARGLDTVADGVPRPLLLIDNAGLHEAGKTVRRGELMTTIASITATDLLDSKLTRWRSAQLIDPTAILIDAAAQLPHLRRSTDAAAFLSEVAVLDATTVERASAADWEERGYSRRRALADVLAVLRALPPRPEGRSPSMPAELADRLADAFAEGCQQLASVEVGNGWPLDAALAVYLRWIGASGDRPLPQPTAASIMTIRTGAQTPGHLHEAMVDAILGEIGAPVQDV